MSQRATQRMAYTLHRRPGPLGLPVILLALNACSMEEVVHGVDEREANDIIEILGNEDPSIDVQKIKEEGRIVTYKLAVSSKQKFAAYKALNRAERPRKKHPGRLDVFSQSGLIPTKAEEVAKTTAAMNGDISHTLLLIPKVLDAEVEVNLPEDNPMAGPNDEKPKTSAAVTMKYLPDAAGQPPISALEVQRLVSSSVKGLKPDDVMVFMSSARGGGVMVSTKDGTPSVLQPTKSFCEDDREPVRLFGRSMCPESASLVKTLVTVFIIMIFLLAGGVVFVFLRGKAVQTRLIRLQTELAGKTKRKAVTQAGQPGSIPTPQASGSDASESGQPPQA